MASILVCLSRALFFLGPSGLDRYPSGKFKLSRKSTTCQVRFPHIHYKMGSNLSASKSPASPSIRHIQVHLSPTQTLSITLPVSKATIRWLLAQVRSHCSFPILGLKSISQNEALDMWLLQLGRPVAPLRDGERLEVVTSGKGQVEPVSGPLSPAHFSYLKVLGKGGNARVLAARKKDSGQLYAVKVMTKRQVQREDKVENVLAERRILAIAAHPFVVKLHYAFQSVIPLCSPQSCTSC